MPLAVLKYSAIELYIEVEYRRLYLLIDGTLYVSRVYS